MSDITKGINGIEDKNATAGMKAIYVANYDEYDFTLEETNGYEISDLPVSFESYYFPLKNTGNTLNMPVAAGRDPGTSAFNATLALVLTKMTPRKALTLTKMSFGRPIIFVEFNSGEVICVGMERGCEITFEGVLEGDLDGANSYNVEAVAKEIKPLHWLSSTAITTLKSGVATGV